MDVKGNALVVGGGARQIPPFKTQSMPAQAVGSTEMLTLIPPQGVA